MNLSTDFTLEEMVKSQMADRLGIDNTPNATQINNLQRLCVNLLQPLRDKFQSPIFVSSGFRNPVVNHAVGGVPLSQHTEGKAADTETFLSTIDWANFVLNTALPFDQLILEFYDAAKGDHSGWVHMSWNGQSNRNQVLTATNVNGHLGYELGLPS